MSRQFLIIWSALMGITLTWMFWTKGQGGSGEVMATLVKREGTVQLRRAGNFDWADIKGGSSLYALDSIATEASSKAIIRLADGTEILLPPDTQLKIQPQSLAQGVEIAVLKGGVAVQKPKVQQGQPAKKGSLISIATPRYKIDLSTLKGTFRLGADAQVQAEQPSTVVLQGAESNLSLAQLKEDGDTVLDGNENDSLFEVEELPPSPPEVALAPPPPPRPLPKPRPTKILSAKPMLRAQAVPAPLALVEEDGDLIFPEWKLSSPNFWIGTTLDDSRSVPVTVPAEWAMSEAEDKWDTIFRISAVGAEKSLLIRRKLSGRGFNFNLTEISSLLGEAYRETQVLSLQSGLVRKTEDGRVARFAPTKIDIQLHSIVRKQAFTLTLDSLEFSQPNQKWFNASPSRLNKIHLHVLNPTRITALEGFLRGSKSFTISPFAGIPSSTVLGLVTGPSLDILSENIDPASLKILNEALAIDLVFKGNARAYLGGKGSFDLMAYLNKSTDVYYIRRGLSLKLDDQLFKTQAAARDFIRKFNPYFFKEPVDIVYSRAP